MNLAHQLRDLPGFRWAPGMLGVPAPGVDHPVWCRILTTSDDGTVYSWSFEDGEILTSEDGPFDRWADLVPDLTDSATAGILLRMVGPDVSVWIFPDDRVHVVTDGADGSGPTLGEACAALMVARGRCS